jgi:hypothetical protein
VVQVRRDTTGRLVISLPPSKTKTKKGRAIPVSANLEAILERRQYVKGRKHGDFAYVFGHRDGKRITTVAKSWTLACANAAMSAFS